MKQVLVTGASGFTGGHLCRRLRENGEQVVAFVRSTSNTAYLRSIGVECRSVDIGDHDSVAANLDGVSTVYHIAAVYRSEHAQRAEFQRINVDATRHLLEASLASGVERFVHCSTVGVQGEIAEPPATEDAPYNPGDHYQQTKLEGELLALEHIRLGLPVSIVRPVGIYGPGDTRFLKLFRSIERGRFVMIGSGRTLYHLTYIDDLISGLLLAGSRPEAVGETFTIGGPNYTTLNELTALIAAALGKRPRSSFRVPYAPVYVASLVCDKACRAIGVNPPLYPRRVEFFSKDRAFDITKARQLLTYEPQVDLRSGLKRTADWYRSEGLL